MRDTRLRRSALGLVALIAIACSDGLVSLRRLTYPPPFHYIPNETVRAAMHGLARGSIELDRLLRESSALGEVPRAEIARVLAEMERVSRDLGPGSAPSNRPELSARVDVFREDLRRARLGVDRDPPNYYFAGTVSGACMYCHDGR